ncbi:hypothetical protein C8R44DRAFT_25143 [Mycena epipterygia]|nr:hypothetical protein C8R44DRAFT_25143 [Mycena epipterygia]
MEGINALIGSPDTLLRTAKSETFVRLVRLALLYHDWDLCRSVVSRWLSRLHWHSISPAPAIVLADAFNLRQLLCHAYYVHLVNVAPRIARSLPIDAGSPLNSTQNVHVLCGYHSLLASWRQLQEAPPTFTAAATCASHPRCLIAWTARWALETGRSTALPPVDLLRRLFVMEENLTADEVLRECMGSECKLRALEAITRKRAEISDNLHHHFDL